jgi:MFS family permease
MQDVLDTLKLKGNTSMIGTVTALYVIGGLFGAIIAVMVGALPGQKKTILIGTSIGAVGAIMHIKQHSVRQ